MRREQPPDDSLSWRLLIGRAGLNMPLEVKLRPPTLREHCLERPRLLRSISGTNARLVLVAAPTGFGKTTLAAQWRASLPSTTSVAWISLDPGDNDPVRLWWHVIRALQQACPDLRDGDDLRPPSAPRPDLAETVLPALVRRLAARTAPVVLVLDDYHLIKERGCHEQLALVLARLPESAQLMLVTRADPPLPLARLRDPGEMIQIRARELRLSTAEAAALIRAVAAVTLTDDDTAELSAWAQGWPAAIALAALALRDNPFPAAFVRRVTLSNGHPADVLADEFLARQAPEVQRFLRRTSILDQFTASLCDTVAGITGGAGIIAGLERDNPFLVPLDDSRQWYAYHPLLAQLLRSRLVRAEPDVVTALHRRASRWYAEQGSARLAISHALSAADTDSAVALIARFWRRFATLGRIATVRAWLSSLGDERIAAHPVAAHCAAWAAEVSGDFAAARHWLGYMEAGRLEGPLPDGMPSLEFSAALLRADGFEGLRVMRESAAAATKLDDDPGSPWYAPARAALGVSLYLSGDAPAAATALEQAVASPAADPPTRMFCLAIAALVAAEHGSLPQAAESARAAREIMERAGLTDTPHGALVWTASAVIHRAQGRTAQARAEFERALRARRQASGITPWPVLAILLRLTAQLLDLGDPPAARELIAQATTMVDHLPAVSGRTSPVSSWPGDERAVLALI